jgi:formylglycine-generating enzyme required for sulfatase activity
LPQWQQLLRLYGHPVKSRHPGKGRGDKPALHNNFSQKGPIMKRSIVISLAIALNALLAIPHAEAAGKRVALVIGNADYSNVGTLANPIADAEAVTQAFKTAGFDEVRHVDNLSADAMRQELKTFSAHSAEAEIAVIYYAGHGVELADQNYLVPVDAKLLRSTDIEFEAIPLSTVRSAVSGATKLRIVVLDACRNNPFKLTGNGSTRAASRGLGDIEPRSGEIVAYSAKEGTLAQDGPAQANSPFAAALVKNLSKPGLEIRLMFGQVHDDVLSATNNEQEPYTYASLGGEAIYLRPPIDTPAVKGPQTFRDCPDCPEMVVVPAGSFVMGSPTSEPDHEKDEGPQHDVAIARDFAMGKFEVTRKQYEDFLTATGYDVGNVCSQWTGTGFKPSQGSTVLAPGIDQSTDHPATCVSWRDAKAFATWLSKRTGFTYRLLTEAEWEYAARAGSSNAFATGQILDASSVNFNSTGTQPVGHYAANNFGLHDMQGNVWEWTEDCYATSYAQAPDDGSAFVTPNCERTYRGGAWANTAKDMRFATRGTNDADKRANIFGIRVARDLR